MSFGCSSKELEKFLKIIHKRYSKTDPQTLLKNWPTNVTQKVIRKCYSKRDPQMLLKK